MFIKLQRGRSTTQVTNRPVAGDVPAGPEDALRVLTQLAAAAHADGLPAPQPYRHWSPTGIEALKALGPRMH